MLKNKRKTFLYIMSLVVAIVLTACIGAVSPAKADSFEDAIADFPESYKPYLRELHEKYPMWTFVPFETGLDWTTVIDNEFGTKNLIEDSVSSENLKSRESGHYNFSTGKYIQKDSGFVVASRLAVEFYMDPRNFLNEEGIFQFEQLSFSDVTTIEDVENVLKGSFMSDKKITYYTASGEKKTSSKTYAQVIFEAGQEYDVNPCYLASKIRNEVGADGSASVSGTHSVYPGIYNFYNIGATDGAGAITRGLQWASSGSTYLRPWTTPAKSIKGGAAYIAEKYVAKGQFTGYLQKFNVNPKNPSDIYQHQYMTNLTGALSQGYTNYTAYAKTGNLYQAYVFSIPIYNNMPSEDKDNQSAINADSLVQYAKISASSSRVRTGPSTGNAQLTDKNGNEILLPKGHEVRVISKVFTDAKYYINQLKYPHWVKVKFDYESKSYTGYVPEDFITLSSYTSVGTGTHTIGNLGGNQTGLSLISSDYSIAKVTSKNTVNFLKSGTVYITSYDSVGRYDIVKYVVSDSAVGKPTKITATATDTSIKVTSNAVSGATKYAFGISDENGNIVENKSSTGRSVTFSSLKKGMEYTVSVRALLDKTTVSVYSASLTKKVATSGTAGTLDKVQNFRAENIGTDVEFSWKEVPGCTGYIIYGYEAATGSYMEIADAIYGFNSMIIDVYSLVYDEYYIAAYTDANGEVIYGDYSDPVTVTLVPGVPQNLAATSVKTTSFKLTWDAAEYATSYNVYEISKGSPVLVANTEKTSYTVKNLTPGTDVAYAVAGAGDGVVSDVSAPIYVMTPPDKVTGLKSSNVTENAVTLKWSDAKGAFSYKVYMLTDGEYVQIAECDDIKYTVKKLSEVTDYTFRVSAVAKSDRTTQEGSMSDTLQVLTALSKVVDVSVDNVQGNNVTLSWQEHPYAQKYAVYVYSDSKKDYVEKVVTEDAYATVTGLKYNKEYTFAVKAIAVKNDTEIYSDYSDTAGAATAYPVPENIKVSDVKSASYKLSWNAVTEAVGYKVYRLKNDSYELVASVSTNYYTVGSLSFGQIDTYKITAVFKEGSKKYESNYSEEIIAATTPAAVKNFKATAYTRTVKLSWSAVENADCYNIYLLEGDKHVLLDTVTGTSCKIEELVPGVEHTFYIRAYIRLTNSTVKGSMTSVGAVTKPVKVEKLTISGVGTTYHTLNWEEAEGANYYHIYQYSSKEKAYVVVAKTKDLSYKFEGLTAGKTYGYKVRSVYTKVSKDDVLGDVSAVFKFTTKPAKTTELKASSVTANSFKLTWKKVSGATYYQVAIYDKAKGDYVTYGTSETNSITVKNLSKATTYKVKVRAVKEYEGKKYYGSYSSVLSVKTK